MLHFRESAVALLHHEFPWSACAARAGISNNLDKVVLLARGQTLVSIADPPFCDFDEPAMTSAASAARIPYKHSAGPRTTTTAPHAGQDPRCATSLHHATSQPDVAASSRVSSSSSSSSSRVVADQPAPLTSTTRFSPSTPTADKVDSQTRSSAPSVKSLRNHSRLASFGRIRSRGSIKQGIEKPPASPGETFGAAVPVSPSDAGSHKRSDGSSLSNNSSETTLSDDSVKLLDEKPPRPSFWQKSPQNSNYGYSQAGFDENYKRLVAQRPHTMHQTSSKLLRMTEDDRPFTRDFKDLFSTLMVSLPLNTHRYRFQKIEHTFTTEEAITNLGSLKFSQSNRMPDPKDPSRIVTTTTTTTFSMAKEMARSVCSRFLDARFIESVESKSDFNSKSSVWQLTPKGMHVLQRFCQRNGIHQRHVNEVLDSPRNMMQLVILERDPETDKLNSDSATVNVIFRRFAGDTGPNLRATSTASDSDSMHDYATGLIGVKMQKTRTREKDSPYMFTGKSAFDWLMDCCTVVDKREVFELANLFMQHGLVELATEGVANQRFAASKHVHYAVTQKGMRAAGWITSPNGSVNGDATTQQRAPAGVARDSNTNRMTVIIRDPALRLLFREYLRETHCEENLAFYVEVKAFLSEYERAKRNTSPPKLDVIRETLASAYSLYNAFLAPGSPCELNIDHTLRNALASRMTKAVGEDEQMLQSLDEVAVLFDQAQSSVFKLMASDSVPKFFREPKYAGSIRERNLEGMLSQFAATSIS